MGFFQNRRDNKRDKEHTPYITKEGYKQVYEPNSPSARENGYAPEQRVIAERMAKRPLKKNEEVHHKDGNKLNNKKRNLEVLTKSEHYKKHNT